MGMAIEMRWLELPAPEGDYVRIGARAFKLQFRDVFPGAGHTDWSDVLIERSLAPSALPLDDLVRSPS